MFRDVLFDRRVEETEGRLIDIKISAKCWEPWPGVFIKYWCSPRTEEAKTLSAHTELTAHQSQSDPASSGPIRDGQRGTSWSGQPGQSRGQPTTAQDHNLNGPIGGWGRVKLLGLGQKAKGIQHHLSWSTVPGLTGQLVPHQAQIW